MLTVKVIRQLLEKNHVPAHLMNRLRADERKGVRELMERYDRRFLAQQQERFRLMKMYSLEIREGMDLGLTAGIDEAGRGPLAGPVYAAAVILPLGLSIPGLKDSKKLSAEKRGQLRILIEQEALAVGWGYGTVEEIDRFNIWEATVLAMRRAVRQLGLSPGLLLVDGSLAPQLGECPVRAVVDGDNRSASIAAASIVAKERRDRIMDQLDQLYPEYGFSRHKGYGTADHYDALARFGPSPVHRRSFLHPEREGSW